MLFQLNVYLLNLREFALSTYGPDVNAKNAENAPKGPREVFEQTFANCSAVKRKQISF